MLLRGSIGIHTFTHVLGLLNENTTTNILFHLFIALQKIIVIMIDVRNF